LVYFQTIRSNSRSDGLTFLEAARRRQIIECAVASLAEDGYRAATLARIAERAEVSKSVIVYHFGTKERLFEQVAAEVFRVAAETVTPQVEAAPTPAAKLRAYIEARVGFLRTHAAFMAALFEIWMNLRGPDGELRFTESDASDTVDAIEELLRAGQRSGEFGDFDPEVMAMVVRQAIDGVLLQSRFRPDLDLDRYARELAAIAETATAARTKKKQTGRKG
jgi:AcrR family transcriptional regulator